MASDKNFVEITGNLTRDPQMRSTPRGMAVCNFSIANNRYCKNGDGFDKETSFFDIQCWDKLAEYVSEVCRKGTSVEIKGKIRQERWMGNDGKNMSKIVIVAESVEKQQRQERQSEPNNNGWRQETKEEYPF